MLAEGQKKAAEEKLREAEEERAGAQTCKSCSVRVPLKGSGNIHNRIYRASGLEKRVRFKRSEPGALRFEV